jgi:hypothetical protein
VSTRAGSALTSALRRPWRAPVRESVLLWCAVLLFSAVKMRGYALHGRFWAEEGRFFHPALAGQDLLRGMTYIYNHHLEMWTNLVMWCSTRVGLERAPLVTTYLSWLLQLLPLGLVIHCRRQFGLSSGRVLLFVFAAAAIPQSGEVWANSINLHFHFALLAGLIAVIAPPSGRQAWLFRGLLAASGLSGIPANSLLPVFVVLAIRGRSRERAVQAGILAATCACQLALLAQVGFAVEGRSGTTDPLLMWLAVLAQHLASPLLGFRAGGVVIGWFDLLESPDPDPGRAAVGVALSAAYVALAVHVVRRRQAAVATSLAAALALAVFCILTSLGDRVVLVSVDVGGRYFYASNLLLVLGLLVLAPRPPARAWRVAVSVWVLLSLHGLKTYLPGPDWAEACRRARQVPAEEIPIWPRGWTMPGPGAKPAAQHPSSPDST